MWRWERSNRYYLATITRDLFGAVCLVAYWGAKDSLRGGMKTVVFERAELAEAALHALDRRRQQRGYERVSVSWCPLKPGAERGRLLPEPEALRKQCEARQP